MTDTGITYAAHYFQLTSFLLPDLPRTSLLFPPAHTYEDYFREARVCIISKVVFFFGHWTTINSLEPYKAESISAMESYGCIPRRG